MVMNFTLRPPAGYLTRSWARWLTQGLGTNKDTRASGPGNLRIGKSAAGSETRRIVAKAETTFLETLVPRARRRRLAPERPKGLREFVING
jgi:hypothetical protein